MSNKKVNEQKNNTKKEILMVKKETMNSELMFIVSLICLAVLLVFTFANIPNYSTTNDGFYIMLFAIIFIYILIKSSKKQKKWVDLFEEEPDYIEYKLVEDENEK